MFHVDVEPAALPHVIDMKGNKMALLVGAALLVAAAPHASAHHSVCDNQPLPEDFSLGLVGVDTGVTDGNGTSACIGSTSLGIDADDPQQGTGVVVEVINCQGDNTPCHRAIDDTGAAVDRSSPDGIILVYVDGQPT